MDSKFLIFKDQLLRSVRGFFYEKNFCEITPAVLHSSVPAEPTIYPFQTIGHTTKGNQTYYLATSPESDCKKALAAGAGNCFAIAPSFRDLETKGPLHNPEFLMLEWYRDNATYENIMSDVRELILFVKHSLDVFDEIKPNNSCVYQGKPVDLKAPWPKTTMTSLFWENAHIRLKDVMGDMSMRGTAKKKGYSVVGATWEQLFHQIFLNEVEAHLGVQPVFVTEFPARISPLCQKIPHQPHLAERFELYLGGVEIANGNTENTYAREILQGFQKETRWRKQKRMPAPGIDTSFLSAVETMGDRHYAGAGLGLDRLLMILGNKKNINPFDTLV